jgi:hypothetical protein
MNGQNGSVRKWPPCLFSRPNDGEVIANQQHVSLFCSFFNYAFFSDSDYTASNEGVASE